MIRGTTVNVGGVDYMVPPLNLEFLEQFEKLQLAPSERTKIQEEIRYYGPFLAENLKRNYPQLDAEKFVGDLDVLSYQAMSVAIWGREFKQGFNMPPVTQEAASLSTGGN